MNKYLVTVFRENNNLNIHQEFNTVGKAVRFARKHRKNYYCLIHKPYYPSKRYKMIHNSYTSPYMVMVNTLDKFSWCPEFTTLGEAKTFKKLYSTDDNIKTSIWCAVREFIPNSWSK